MENEVMNYASQSELDADRRGAKRRNRMIGGLAALAIAIGTNFEVLKNVGGLNTTLNVSKYVPVWNVEVKDKWVRGVVMWGVKEKYAFVNFDGNDEKTGRNSIKVGIGGYENSIDEEGIVRVVGENHKEYSFRK